ncbi:MAG: O-antigen ligase family protein [Flavobacteriales bacterium]|nr:O-antigen ligase family protein [Flavobacteriales bacterium]
MKKEHIYLGAMASCYGGVFLSYGPIYLCHILLLLSFAMWLISRKGTSSLFVKKSTTLYLFPLIFLVWYGISALWAIDPKASLKYMYYVIMGVTICFSIVEYATTPSKLNRLLQFTGVIVGLEMIVSGLERFQLFRWPISPYSPLSAHFGREYKIESAYSAEIVEHLQTIPTGFHWNPNNTAIAILISIPFFLFSKSWILKVLGTVMGIFVIFSGNSRTALLALALLFVCGVFYLKPKVRNMTIIGGIVLIGIISTVSYVQKNSIYHQVNYAAASLEAMFSEEHRNISSISVRRNLAENSKNALFDSWGAGVGGGNAKVIQNNMGLLDQKTVSQHNFWLEILVEGGLFIFLAFIGWMAYLIFKLAVIYKTSRSEIKWIAGACSLALVGFSFGCISLSSAIFFMPMWMLFGVSVATINLFQKENE